MIQNASGGDLGSFGLSSAAGAHRRLVIGRADDCDLRIRHGSISRHHCCLEQDDDGEWVLRDLGSTLGTIVDEVRVAEAAVHDGLVARIGSAVLRFQAVPASVPPRDGPART